MCVCVFVRGCLQRPEDDDSSPGAGVIARELPHVGARK